VAGVEATPGKGTHVPLYILGSSLFGAQLAARLGLPYAFASHFAPNALEEAVEVYRRDFRPSQQLEAPYVIAGMNVLAADTRAEAEAQFQRVKRSRVKILLGRGLNLTGEEGEVKAYLERFTKLARADEVMTVHPAPTLAARLRSVEILAATGRPAD
jgi:alkanesulfonate monooxygenase SsuD/methylene tetrahydromethanopterin reductase-like flavin-dependent oxidoreductase (luciferase family)